MKLPRLLLFLTITLSVVAQNQPTALIPGSSGNVGPLLSRIEQEAQGLNTDVGRLRVDKWKTDSGTKQQANENISSVQRNVTAALPELVAAVRNNPNALGTNFKLYRNLNALYDVLASLGESAGAFGKREEYESLSPHVAACDELRRSYADLLQQMATSADNRLAAAQQAAAAAARQPPPPKKIVVDDTEPPKSTAKKKVKKSTATPTAAATSTPR